jgi:hypothetical protein
VPEEQPEAQSIETRERTIELGETRRGLDSMGVEPPKPAIELIAQTDDPAGTPAGATMPQASALPPPAVDYPD